MGPDFECRRECPPQEMPRLRDPGRNGHGDHGEHGDHGRSDRSDRSDRSPATDSADLRFGGADLLILAPEDAGLAGVAARHGEAALVPEGYQGISRDIVKLHQIVDMLKDIFFINETVYGRI